MENRMKKIYLAQALASQQHKKAVKGVGLPCKTTSLVHPSATIPPVVDVYGEYYRGGSTTGGWEIKAKGGSRHKSHVRAAARPIATIPGLQDIMIQGGKKPKKPRTTQARPISAKPLTREEILLDTLQKELVRAETQHFNPHRLYTSELDINNPMQYLIDITEPPNKKQAEYNQIAKEQMETYEKKKASRLLAQKLAKERGTYYYEKPTAEELLNIYEKLMVTK